MFYEMLIIYTLVSSATVMDYKYYKIPNALTMWGFIFVIIFSLLLKVTETGWALAGGLAIPMALLYPVYVIGGIGAGDIKLLCVIGGMLGTKSSFRFTVLCFIVAGIIGIFKLGSIYMEKRKTARYNVARENISKDNIVRENISKDNIARENTSKDDIAGDNLKIVYCKDKIPYSLNRIHFSYAIVVASIIGPATNFILNFNKEGFC